MSDLLADSKEKELLLQSLQGTYQSARGLFKSQDKSIKSNFELELSKAELGINKFKYAPLVEFVTASKKRLETLQNCKKQADEVHSLGVIASDDELYIKSQLLPLQYALSIYKAVNGLNATSVSLLNKVNTSIKKIRLGRPLPEKNQEELNSLKSWLKAAFVEYLKLPQEIKNKSFERKFGGDSAALVEVYLATLNSLSRLPSKNEVEVALEGYPRTFLDDTDNLLQSTKLHKFFRMLIAQNLMHVYVKLGEDEKVDKTINHAVGLISSVTDKKRAMAICADLCDTLLTNSKSEKFTLDFVRGFMVRGVEQLEKVVDDLPQLQKKAKFDFGIGIKEQYVKTKVLLRTEIKSWRERLQKISQLDGIDNSVSRKISKLQKQLDNIHNKFYAHASANWSWLSPEWHSSIFEREKRFSQTKLDVNRRRSAPGLLEKTSQTNSNSHLHP